VTGVVRRSPSRGTGRGGQLAWSLGCFGLFALLAVLVRVGWTPLTDLDTRIAQDLHASALHHPGQVTAWQDVSDVLSPLSLRIAALVAICVLPLWRRALRSAAVLLLVVLGGWLLEVVGKAIVDRDRPHFAHPVAHAAGQSFPSGHALTSFVVLVTAVSICPVPTRRPLAVLCAVLVAAVGFSRLYIGVHYLSDVVGGWLLGAAWVWLVLLAAGHARGTRQADPLPVRGSRVRDFRAGRWSRSRRHRTPGPPRP
jgi:membrane-associated phospholipid phosphatase